MNRKKFNKDAVFFTNRFFTESLFFCLCRFSLFTGETTCNSFFCVLLGPFESRHLLGSMSRSFYFRQGGPLLYPKINNVAGRGLFPKGEIFHNGVREF